MSAPVPEATVLATLIRRVKALEWDGWMPGSLPGRGKRGTGGLVLGLVFQVGGPSSSAQSGAAFIRYGVYGSPTIFHWRESIISVPTGHSRHAAIQGYFILIVVSMPSIEWVAINVPSTGGAIGAHMPLWAPP
jgi:hypothetical protein